MKTRGKAGYRAKKRNAHSRERRSTILIAAEGKNQTETQYFRDFAKEYGVHVLVSSPCFEIWFLCHYSASTRRYASYDEVRAELWKYHDGYEKNSVGMFETTKVKLSDAITNAERLKHACEENGYRLHTVEFAPSSEVGELAKKLTQS